MDKPIYVMDKPIEVVPIDKVVPKKRAYTLKKREKKEIVEQPKTQFRINPNIKL